MISDSVRENIYRLLGDSITSLRACMELNSAKVKHSAPPIARDNLWQWLRDFRTIRVDAGMRTGKTAWARNNLGELDTLVTFHSSVAQLLRTPEVKHQITCVAELPAANIGVCSQSVIVIDMASLFYKDQLELVYKELGQYDEQTFILLG